VAWFVIADLLLNESSAFASTYAAVARAGKILVLSYWNK
jgi:hypothetical protein